MSFSNGIYIVIYHYYKTPSSVKSHPSNFEYPILNSKFIILNSLRCILHKMKKCVVFKKIANINYVKYKYLDDSMLK